MKTNKTDKDAKNLGNLMPLIISAFLSLLVPLASQAASVKAPAFEVDPYWPQPLPNHWVLGSAIGVGVDSRDHVFVIHRRNSFNERTEIGAATDPKTAECCIPCLLYTSPSPRDRTRSRMPSSA